MRQIGRKIGKTSEGNLQPREGRIERVGQIGQFSRHRLDIKPRIEALHIDFLRLQTHRPERRQPPTHRQPAEKPRNDRGRQNKQPQGRAKRGHEHLVVRNIRGDGNHGLAVPGQLHPHRPTPERLILRRSPCHRTRALCCWSSEKFVRKVGVTRGKHRSAGRIDHHDGQTAMADQRVVKQLWQRFEILVGRRLLKRLSGLLKFAGNNLHILFDEMLLDSHADQVAQHKDHHRGGNGKQRRQAQRQAASHRLQTATSSSST